VGETHRIKQGEVDEGKERERKKLGKKESKKDYESQRERKNENH
jgi:hypothetical protein